MNRTSDVIVIGGGVIGCAIGYELARRGARVLIIEMRQAGLGATQASAGMLAPYIEGRAGGALLQLAARSLAIYDEFVPQVSADSGVEIEYLRPGTLQVATDEQAASALSEEASRLVATGVAARFVGPPELAETEPLLAPDIVGGLLVPSHGYVRAGAMTSALEAALVRHGARFEIGRVLEVVRGGGCLRVKMEAAHFDARTVVLAAGSWSGRVQIENVAAVPVRPVRGQLVQLESPAPLLRHVIWGPDCYLVPWADGTLLVGATSEDAGFDERATAAGVRDLLEAVCELVPHAWQAGFTGVRVGLRPATPDELPIVGASARLPGLVYATGHYRNGILLAPLTARLVAALILEEHADPVPELSPQRFGEL
jgi:glycine oxidase